MDIRPGQSPGNIFASAEANPLGQSGLSFDEESPDSVLNPDGSVGYLAARLSKERGATAERLRTLSAMEQRGDCLLYTSPSPRDATLARMPSSA